MPFYSKASPVMTRADFKIVPTKPTTYKAVHGLSPTYLFNLVLPYIPTHMLRSQDAGLVIVPRMSKQSAGGRAFSYRAKHFWNGLPIHDEPPLLSLPGRLPSPLGFSASDPITGAELLACLRSPMSSLGGGHYVVPGVSHYPRLACVESLT